MLANTHSLPLPPIPPDPTPTPPTFTDNAILKDLNSFPSGSAPGPSSFRASHLKEAVRCPSPALAERVTRSLTALVNILCAGQTPPTVVPHLCGATLLPSQKKDGGLWPIAVGEVLCCLTSKYLSQAVLADAFQALTPLQMGVGVKGGCEAIVHSIAHTMEDPNLLPDDCWTLLMDFSNAFNSVNRGLMFKEIRAHIPAIAT